MKAAVIIPDNSPASQAFKNLLQPAVLFVFSVSKVVREAFKRLVGNVTAVIVDRDPANSDDTMKIRIYEARPGAADNVANKFSVVKFPLIKGLTSRAAVAYGIGNITSEGIRNAIQAAVTGLNLPGQIKISTPARVTFEPQAGDPRVNGINYEQGVNYNEWVWVEGDTWEAPTGTAQPVVQDVAIVTYDAGKGIMNEATAAQVAKLVEPGLIEDSVNSLLDSVLDLLPTIRKTINPALRLFLVVQQELNQGSIELFAAPKGQVVDFLDVNTKFAGETAAPEGSSDGSTTKLAE